MCFSGCCSSMYCVCLCFFFFKQKTAYEMRISDWSSDVCSSDLRPCTVGKQHRQREAERRHPVTERRQDHGVEDQNEIDQRQKPMRPEIGRASCRERECQYV